MIVEFSVIPYGSGGVHMSGKLAQVMQIIHRSGLDYRVGPMGTVVEGNWESVMRLVKRCHQVLLSHHPRVLTHISIDDRKNAKGRLVGKVSSVARKARVALRT